MTVLNSVSTRVSSFFIACILSYDLIIIIIIITITIIIISLLFLLLLLVFGELRF